MTWNEISTVPTDQQLIEIGWFVGTVCKQTMFVKARHDMVDIVQPYAPVWFDESAGRWLPYPGPTHWRVPITRGAILQSVIRNPAP